MATAPAEPKSNRGRLAVGAAIDQKPSASYTSQLKFCELHMRMPLPKAQKLASWRKDLPRGFRTSLVAPTGAFVSEKGPFRVTPELETSKEWLATAAAALGTSIVLLRTPAAFTPGARDRELFAKYVDTFPRIGTGQIAWEPSGLWDPDEAFAFASSVDVLCAFNPLDKRSMEAAAEATPKRGYYARISGVGRQRRLSSALLDQATEQLAEIAREAKDTFVVLIAETPIRSAVSVAAQLTELMSGDAPPRRSFGDVSFRDEEE